MINCLQCKSALVADIGERMLVTCPACEFIFALSPGGRPEIPTWAEEEGLARTSARQAIMAADPRSDATVMATDHTMVGDPAENMADLPLPRGKQLFVEVLEGGGASLPAGSVVQLTKGRTVFGRTDADVTIDDDQISRKHFVIEALSRENIYLRDLASTNGTWLNDHRVTMSKLRCDDEVRAGRTRLRFRTEG